MLLSQSVKSAGEYDRNNPHNLFSTYKKPFSILVGANNPLVDDGTYGDYYINTTTGDFFEKDFGGVWNVIYNFDTGGGGGGITNIENDGGGFELFKTIIGTTAHFRTLTGTLQQIVLIESANEIQLTMSSLYKPETLSNVGNFRIQGGLGVGTANPNGVLGTTEGFNEGSLYVQINTPKNLIWICENPAATSWAVYSEVLSLVNLGSGAHVVASFDSQGTAYFRGIKGATGQIVASQTANDIDLSMDATYKPLTLNKVDNVKNSFNGGAVPPTVNDDNTLGFQVGSIWTQNALFPAGPHIYVCASAATGAAVWKDISSTPSIISFDYINWRNDGSYVQSIIGGFQDFNFGPTVLTEVAFDSTIWSTSFDGTRQIFTKGASTGTKSYHVDFSLIASDLLGPRTEQKHYTIYMIRKSDSFIYRQSTCLASTPPTTLPNCWLSVSHGFIIKETTTTPVSYYFRIAGDAGHNFNVERWSLAIHEI